MIYKAKNSALSWMMVFFAVIAFAPPLLAYTDGELGINKIDFYDPESVECGAGAVGDSNIQRSFNYFVSRGLTNEQAAGILGNFREESYSESTQDIEPTITQGGALGLPIDVEAEEGYGLAQWTTLGRKRLLVNFAEAQGRQYDTLELQLDFVWFELTGEPHLDGVSGHTYTTAFEELVESETPEEAARAFQLHYEANHQVVTYYASVNEINRQLEANEITQSEYDQRLAEIEETAFSYRQGLAQDMYLNYNVTSENCYINTDGLINTVLTYAWPFRVAIDSIDPNHPNHAPKKPEYEQAIQEACMGGGYVGAGGCGSTYAGVDCGGFVTRVMIDSGFDPGYNPGKSWTLVQQQYLQENWQLLSVGSTADLQPGDVALVHEGDRGHTFLYVGEIPGFDSITASSALNSRAPAAGSEGIFWAYSAGGPKVDWYRKVN